MARRKGNKRPFAPGAGQDAGRQRGSPDTIKYGFKGRNAGGKLHRQGKKVTRGATPQAVAPRAPKPTRPSASVTDEAEVVAFTAAAARRGAPSLTAQRERLIELGLIKKEVANV